MTNTVAIRYETNCGDITTTIPIPTTTTTTITTTTSTSTSEREVSVESSLPNKILFNDSSTDKEIVDGNELEIELTEINSSFVDHQKKRVVVNNFFVEVKVDNEKELSKDEIMMKTSKNNFTVRSFDELSCQEDGETRDDDEKAKGRERGGGGGDSVVFSRHKNNFLVVDSSPPSSEIGKRKRRPPRSPHQHDDLSSAGWCRCALELLSRVVKFRNPNKEKGKSNPGVWFNFPVDSSEVPDYYDIIHHPMDFSKIKHNLKIGAYDDWSRFHSDMLLIRDNCYLYNAVDSEVRQDCDLVFNFYLQEYNKTILIWKQQQQHHTSLSSNSYHS